MKANILVIDDEESLRFTFERFLKVAGHNVVTAGNCREALEKIDGDRFDLILSDVSLPDGLGVDILQEVRQKCPGCPVIVITAYPSVEGARLSFRLGAFDYITKPVRQQEVMQSVEEALRQGRRNESPRCCQ